MKIFFHSEEEGAGAGVLNGVFAARVINYPPVAPGVTWDFSVLCASYCYSLCNSDIAYLESSFIYNAVEDQ